MAEAGWYPDPQDSQSLQYFDGLNWTGQRRPFPGAQPAAPPAQSSAPSTPSSAQPGEPTTQQPRWAETQASWSQQQTSQQPSQQPQQWGQQPQSQWAQQPQTPPPGWAPTPSSPQRRKKTPLIIGAVVLVAALVAVLAFVLLRGGGDDPSITYQGKALANGAEALTSAESSLASVVTRRHGAKNANTRCYYVIPDAPESGAKKTDIERTLRCGPVLFVDGTKGSEYVAVGVTGTVSGDKATLTTQDVADDVTPAKLDEGISLVRPDGKKPATGDSGLAVPTPPAAETNILTVSALDASVAPKALTGAVMIGLTTRVTVGAAGVITRYGADDDARSAPAGQQLIAFQVSYGPGESSGTGAVKATLVVNGSGRALPLASGSDQWIVAAVPTSSRPVLQLVDGGITQTLSLPDGKPGANNAAVTLRQHDSVVLNELFTVPIRASNAGKSQVFTVTARATGAVISFWAPGHETVHASSGAKAILSVRLLYTGLGSTASDPGGFDPELLRLRLPSGQLIPARNIANNPKAIFNVFEVPADFTTGRIEITGTERSGNIRITIAALRGFTVAIPAG